MAISVDALVAPFSISWPEHWAPGEQRRPRDELAFPREDVEKLCGPQTPSFLGDVMHSLDASFLQQAVLQVRRELRSMLPETTRSRLRVINLPGERGRARRDHIEKTCLDPLRQTFPSLDVGFADGVVAKDLRWSTETIQNTRVDTVAVSGQTYTANHELWHGPDGHEVSGMQRIFAADGWNAFLWQAFLQDCSEPNSWGYVGCQIAHVEAWREALAAGVEWLLVCEDDVCPIPLFDLDWVEVWAIVAREVMALAAMAEPWDLLFVGKGSSVSKEGRMITPLIVECGYNIKMHCYCISKQGMAKLLASRLPYSSIRPQDEVLAALNVQGRHPRERLREKIKQLFPAVHSFRSLCFPWWGIVFQLQHFEHHRSSELCRSAIGELGRE